MKAIRVLSSVAMLVALTASIAAANPTSSRLAHRDAGSSWGQHTQYDQRGQYSQRGQYNQRGQYGQRGQFNQRGRYNRHQGQLTWWEAAQLRAGQAQIARMERLARADGFVSFRERQMIQRAKLQQMRMAFRFRNNGRSA